MKWTYTVAEHNEIGKIGEKLVKDFLFRYGFSVVCMNFRTKFGEIDIVAEKDKKIHFIEVKSIKVRDYADIGSLHVKPEDNLTAGKWEKLVTSVRIYLKSRGVPEKVRWQMDLACVYIDTETRQGKVILMDNIHKE